METRSELEKLTLLLKNGVKIDSIEQQGDATTLRLISGVNLTPSPPQLLMGEVVLKTSPELQTFLASGLVDTALYHPVQRGIVLADMVAYSKGDTALQAAYLSTFGLAITSALEFARIFSKTKTVEQIIPTGDGCYIVFDKSLNDRFFRVVFGMIARMQHVQNRILKQAGLPYGAGERIHLRLSCELGETDFFYDLAGNRNCFGTGMNEASRILSCGTQEANKRFQGESTEDSIFLGEKVFPQAERLQAWLSKICLGTQLDPLGDLIDKHDMSRKVWWMRGMSKAFGLGLFSFNELIEGCDG